MSFLPKALSRHSILVDESTFANSSTIRLFFVKNRVISADFGQMYKSRRKGKYMQDIFLLPDLLIPLDSSHSSAHPMVGNLKTASLIWQESAVR